MQNKYTLLIYVDGHPHSQHSIELACRLFDLTSCHIILLHAIQQAEPSRLLKDKSGHMEEEHLIIDSNSARDLLQVLAQQLSTAGAHVEIEVKESLAASMLLSMAERHQQPIIMLPATQLSARDLFLRSSIISNILRSNFQGMLIQSRVPPSDSNASQIVFFLDESQESIDGLKYLAPAFSNLVPLLIVSSEVGFQQVYSQPAYESILKHWQSGHNMSSELQLETVRAFLTDLQKHHEQLIIKSTYERWLKNFLKEKSVSLLVQARSIADLQHRSLKGPRSEHIFLNTQCSTALYCCNSDTPAQLKSHE